MKTLLRSLPAIHEIQHDKRFLIFIHSSGVSKDAATSWIQEIINTVRHDIVEGKRQSVDGLFDEIFSILKAKAKEDKKSTLTKVINATGTILHTNLGRAKLSEDAVAQVQAVAMHYSNLEYQLEKGTRGSRHDIIESIIQEVTGAEAAMVVNNNAAAVYFILKAFAKGKEVIVSRGQLVEIGGSFRVSSIMEESGASLVEVGTTNKTHPFDYEKAITENTAMMMKVHTSNFKTIGFTKSVTIEELVQIKNKHNLLLYEDLGSGAIYDFRTHGIGDEPTVRETLEKGVDIVSFSGDKLLGGPQAGIIAGKKELIAVLKKHQLARVLRVDKMTLAALEATLKAYRHSFHRVKEIPTVSAILSTVEEVEQKARQFVQALTYNHFTFQLEEGTSQIGGGTMPGVDIPTMLVYVSHPNFSAQELFEQFLKLDIPIVCRRKDDHLVFDFRTIEQQEVNIVIEQVKQWIEKTQSLQ